jgi:hypothetical protein
MLKMFVFIICNNHIHYLLRGLELRTDERELLYAYMVQFVHTA